MDHRPDNQKLLRAGICALLLAAIVLGMFVPGISLVPEAAPAPAQDQPVEDIRLLELGQNEGEQTKIQVPSGEKPKPTEPEPSTPEQKEDRPSNQPTQAAGNDQGNQGAAGDGSLSELSMVLSWYRYDNEEQSLSCQPMNSVSETVNLAQLPQGLLRYTLTPQGMATDQLRDIQVTVAEGDSQPRQQDQQGQITLSLPTGSDKRAYTFYVTAQAWDGETSQWEQVRFTFRLDCVNVPDLNLQLTWLRTGGEESTVTCAPGGTERFSVRSTQVEGRAFSYRVMLTGRLAETGKITGGTYSTNSGRSGQLEEQSGAFLFNAAPDSDKETYYLTYRATDADREFTYQFVLDYQETLDVRLDFKWRGKGGTENVLSCEPGQTAVQPLLTTQLSSGGIGYTLDISDGRILKASYTSTGTGGGELDPDSGRLKMSIPQGQTANSYTVTVTALVNSRTVTFTIRLELCSDVTAQMTYQVDGEERVLFCENGKTTSAEDVYDDELTDGRLEYKFALVGEELSGLSLENIRLYQSGSGRTTHVEASGTVTLQQNDGKRGWNEFTLEAQGADGESYKFTFRIPFKHRGDNTIQIDTNLTDGQTVTNDTDVLLTVTASSQSPTGEITYIPAKGTDTKLIVKLDGQEVNFESSSGHGWEYTLHPENPEVGDQNTHTLTIYAEDSLGNYGEKTLTLRGQRADAGQGAGKAAIYVDMTVLGIGVVGPLYYDVLANEPVSYTVAKAVLGMDTGVPFGAASDTFGWQGRYGGTLDVGFYLQSLTTNLQANALEDSSWPGRTEEEILDAIDQRFGKRSNLATLWRCLYRNGLNKSSGSGSRFGEFDYTSGSGWLYSVGNTTYYPGQSMSKVYLKDGDVLTLRYTLAYGWDVGGGTEEYGNTVGYCITAVNGSFSVPNHQYETVDNGDGTTTYRCRCCGLVEECQHQQVTYVDQGDGTHVCRCLECGEILGDPELHRWNSDGGADANHVCLDCSCKEPHIWQEIDGTGTATCTQGGTIQQRCVECGAVRETETAPLGHAWDNRWNFTAQGHYRQCSRCGEQSDIGNHTYVYDTDWSDFVCTACGAHHDMDFDECAGQKVLVSADCTQLVYQCQSCGYTLVEPGVFEEYHQWTDWEPDPEDPSLEIRTCTVCGATQTQ